MVIKQKFSIDYQYDIIFTRDLFSRENETLIRVLGNQPAGSPVRIVFVVDGGLAEATPGLTQSIEQYFIGREQIRLLAPPLVVVGGEECKNDTAELMKTLELIDKAGVDRHAYLLAVGGGAVLDMTGFAAAIAHRGIRHIRIPSTTLSQNDSGVGVKNGINFFGKKNFLGAFVPPYAVVNDLNLLNTLDIRDWRSGIAEAIKVSLIKDKDFFEWVEENATRLNERDAAVMERLIYRCAELHVHHIGSSDDPFEMGSSRPLDFGHWAAHKMEQLTRFELKHGEAVAIGIALDISYAVEAGYLDPSIADRILNVLRKAGFNLVHPLLFNQDGTAVNPDLIQGLEEFREHLGGQLTIPMISEIGSKFDVHEMNPLWIDAAALSLLQKQELYAHFPS